MKKVFLSTFVLAIGLGFSSCNNGAYDANPTTNNSNIPNPFLNTEIELGTILADLNGVNKEFKPATYTDVGNVRGMGGIRNPGSSDQETMTVNIVGFDGAKEYNYDGSEPGLLGFAVLDAPNGTAKSTYGSSTGDASKGRAKIVVTSVTDEGTKGTFEGVMYRMYPNLDLNDSIVVTNGEFFVPKQQ